MSVRLQNATTGVFVSVSEETAANLDANIWRDPKAATPRSESPDSTWKVGDLKAYAEENEIDLGEATKKDDILAAITAAGNPDE